MPYEKKKKFIVDILFYTIIAAITFFTLKYVLVWVMPFLIAFIVSAFIAPVANKISANFRVSKKFSACFTAFLFYSIAVGIIFLAGFGLYNGLKNLFSDLPHIYENNIAPTLASLLVKMQDFLVGIDPSLSSTVQEITFGFAENSGSMVSDISVGAIGWMSSYIARVPYFVAAVFVSVIATFFIASDYENIRSFIVRQIPEKWHLFLSDVRRYSLKTLGKYLKSYALIMTVTFCELSLALWLLDVNNFMLIALIIAAFDIIPVCGSGGMLIPWAAFSLLQGRLAFGILMLVVYAIITVIRQIIEPKIVGDQVGLPPVVTLMAMFLGVRFMGVFGLFAFPITLVILKNLNDNGRIRLFR